MLIAEDLLLLATDDGTGKTSVPSTQLDPALAGAVLIDLVAARRVDLEGEGRRAKVVAIDGTPLVGVLLDGQEPDGRAAALISLLTAADMLKTVVDRPHIKAAKARGQELGRGNWASDSVRKVIQQTQAAVATAVMVSTSAAYAGGSS